MWQKHTKSPREWRIVLCKSNHHHHHLSWYGQVYVQHPALRPETLASKYGSIVQGMTRCWCCQCHHGSVQRAALMTRHLYYLRRSRMLKPAERRKTAFKQSAGEKNRLSEYLTRSFSHSLGSCRSFNFKMSTLSPSLGTLFTDQFTA